MKYLLILTYSTLLLSYTDLLGNNSLKVKDKYQLLIERAVKNSDYVLAEWWLYEILAKGVQLNSRMNDELSRIISHRGSSLLEIIPIKELQQNSRLDGVRLITAKKLVKKLRFTEAIQILQTVSNRTRLAGLKNHLLGISYNMIGNYAGANVSFERCVDEEVNTFLDSVNREACILAIARSKFNQRKYEEAELLFLNLPKKAYVWPYTLQDEAWNSFYEKRYNRTLGKLVTFKSPYLNSYLTAESLQLQGYSYFKKCLYDDFTQEYKNYGYFYKERSSQISKILSYARNDFYSYYEFSVGDEVNLSNQGLKKFIKSNLKLRILYKKLDDVLKSLNKFDQRQDRFRNYILDSHKKIIKYYQRIIGILVKNILLDEKASLVKGLEYYSYMKLELLSQRKKALYKNETITNGKRGELKYLARNDAQYFWDFNGEFWADEIGDYVFSLPDLCK